MLTELTTDNLQEFIDNGGTVVVQYSASWCGNCRIMKPKFKKLAEGHADAQFILVDAEKNPASRQLAKVDNLPTFAAFKGGQIVGQVQTNKFEVLKSMVDEITNN